MSPPTPDQFAAVVARLVPEIKAADTDTFTAWTALPYRTADPPALTRVRWATELVDGPIAARICRYHYQKTWLVYENRANADRRNGHHDPRLMPPPAEGEFKRTARWELGTLAIWQAVKQSRVLTRFAWPGHEQWHREIHKQMADPRGAHTDRALAAHLGVSRELARELIRECGYTARRTSIPDEKLIPIAQELIAAMPVPPRPHDLIRAADAAGYKIRERAAGRILTLARGDKMPAYLDADTNDGLIRPSTLARRAKVGVNTVNNAMGKCWFCGGKRDAPWHAEDYRAARGEPRPHPFRAWLTPVRRDQWGWLIDPNRVKTVKGLRTPVDSDLRPEDRNSDTEWRR